MNLRRNRSNTARQRGATLVEYTLLVGVFCLGASAGISYLEDQAESQMRKTASEIGQPTPVADVGVDDDGSGGPAATTSTTTTTTSTTTTTRPPTTTTPPTTTSTTTTTTTVPPTTTTAAPNGTGWSAGATKQNKNKWTANAAVTVYGTDGKPMNIDMGVRILVTQTYRTWDGKTQTRTWETTANIDKNGRATVTNADLNTGANGQEAILAMTYEVTGVSYYWPSNPTIKWDGATPSVKVDVPN